MKDYLIALSKIIFLSFLLFFSLTFRNILSAEVFLDSSGNIFETSDKRIEVTVKFKPGWNMKSWPVRVNASYDIASFFAEDELESIFKFSVVDGSYVSVPFESSLEDVAGYWIKIRNDIPADRLDEDGFLVKKISGLEIKGYASDLEFGWYLLTSVSADGVPEVEGYESTVYVFENGAYRLVESGEEVKAGDSFWFKVGEKKELERKQTFASVGDESYRFRMRSFSNLSDDSIVEIKTEKISWIWSRVEVRSSEKVYFYYSLDDSDKEHVLFLEDPKQVYHFYFLNGQVVRYTVKDTNLKVIQSGFLGNSKIKTDPVNGSSNRFSTSSGREFKFALNDLKEDLSSVSSVSLYECSYPGGIRGSKLLEVLSDDFVFDYNGRMSLISYKIDQLEEKSYYYKIVVNYLDGSEEYREEEYDWFFTIDNYKPKVEVEAVEFVPDIYGFKVNTSEDIFFYYSLDGSDPIKDYDRDNINRNSVFEIIYAREEFSDYFLLVTGKKDEGLKYLARDRAGNEVEGGVVCRKEDNTSGRILRIEDLGNNRLKLFFSCPPLEGFYKVYRTNS